MHSVQVTKDAMPSTARPLHLSSRYELRTISQVPFDTTRSIWTFVTNQRRILDDNAHARITGTSCRLEPRSGATDRYQVPLELWQKFCGSPSAVPTIIGIFKKRNSRYDSDLVLVTVKKNSGANRDAAEERSVPCPHNPRNLWQIFNGIEQNEKMKSCGQKYWVYFTPSKILEHFGLQSTRETAAKSVTGARVSSSC